jgi:glycosidase
VRAEHPNAWFLGQVFDDDLPQAINSAGFSSATEYGLMHGIRDGLATADAGRLQDALLLHRHNSTHRPVHTFVGNHDFARLADVVPTSALPLAFVLLLTLPGTPAIYYGDEFAATSSWTGGASDAELRPQLTPVATDGRNTALLSQIEQLGNLRRTKPWLATALMTVESVDHGLRYTIRPNLAEPDEGDPGLTVIINPTSRPLNTGADSPPFLTGTDQPTTDTQTLPSYGWAIYEQSPRNRSRLDS